jgi:hypothetical protein
MLSIVHAHLGQLPAHPTRCDDREMEPASTHLQAELALPPAGAVRETLQWVGSMLGGMFEGQPPATIDLIVTRRDTGAVIMRHTIDNTIEADFALEAANRDLDRMTVAEFIRAWREQAEPAASGNDTPEPPTP